MLGLSARSAYHKCDANPETCTTSDKDSISARALYADVLIGAAIAGTATAVVLYWRSARTERATVTPPDQATAVEPMTFVVAPTRGGAFAELRVGF